MGTNWNRTQVLAPSGEPIAGALMVHGLTDTPYSMRTLGEQLQARGYYAMALRVPGHGTVPAGLTVVKWEDWLAAVRLGVRHVRATIGPDKPIVLVGYSNGGALVTKYALDVLEGSGDPQVERIVLMSPMIGVTPFAWMARVISMLGPIPAFEKARWLDVIPEYNPFKYNSFPANCRAADVEADDDDAEAARTRRERGANGEAAAVSDVSITRRFHGEHTGRRPCALRRGGGRAVRAGALRHQSGVRPRAVHP